MPDANLATNDESDGKLLIKDIGNSYIFKREDMKSQTHSREVAGHGVFSHVRSADRVINAYEFSKPEWSFEKVHEWLVAAGFEPSADQQLKFADSDEIHMMMSVQSVMDKQLKFSAADEAGADVVKVTGLAITPGIHETFKFGREMLARNVHKWNRVRIVLDHRYNEPVSVVGFGAKQRMVKEGVEVDGVVYDPATMKAVLAGDIHSFSTNFLVRADRKTHTVNDITKVVELSFATIPIDPNSVIKNSEQVALNLSATVPPTQVQLPSPVEVGETMENPGTNVNPAAPPVGAPAPTAAPVPAVVSPTDTTQQLKLSQMEERMAQQERLLKKEMEKNLLLSQNVTSMNAQQTLSDAALKAKELVSVHCKFAVHTEPAIASFYASLSSEQEKLFNEIVSSLPAQIRLGAVGETMQQPRSVMNDDEYESLLLSQINNEWQATGGDGPYAQMQHLQPGGQAIFQQAFGQQPVVGPNNQPQFSQPHYAPYQQQMQFGYAPPMSPEMSAQYPQQQQQPQMPPQQMQPQMPQEQYMPPPQQPVYPQPGQVFPQQPQQQPQGYAPAPPQVGYAPAPPQAPVGYAPPQPPVPAGPGGAEPPMPSGIREMGAEEIATPGNVPAGGGA